MSDACLMDTHALLFWVTRENVSEAFIDFLDARNDSGNLMVSSISFWEIALLEKKGCIELDDVAAWRTRLLDHTNVTEATPSATEMIESVNLPEYHRDPFDRLLIVQALRNNAFLITKDKHIARYKVKTFWM